MPGSLPGERRGGRKKGTPNKAISAQREAFGLMFARLKPDIEGWIREVATGWESVRTLKDGRVITVIEGRDPGRAAELVLRMAEFVTPRLGRQELSGPEGAPISLVIQEDKG